MNKDIKYIIKTTSSKIGSLFRGIAQSGISIMRMCVLSSIGVAIKSRKYSQLKASRDCCVLGNGPSLKTALDNGEVRLDGNDVFCVNLFCSSSYFTIIKPRFYFIIDNAFYNPQIDRHRECVATLVQALNSVNWDMHLVLSTTCDSKNLLKLVHNPQITVIKFNCCAIDGFKGFRHLLYRANMGMPRCQTVINFALTSAIDMEYKNIYLYGADHTWTRDLTVDDDNTVCYGDRHVYNPNIHIIKKKDNIAFILECFSKMFASHYLIREYAESEGCTVYNCTQGSFVDAYKRMQ